MKEDMDMKHRRSKKQWWMEYKKILAQVSYHRTKKNDNAI